MVTERISNDEDGGTRIDDIYIPPPPPPSLTFDPTGPRLMISKVVIHNFKSYGGTVTLGPFQKNFSAIVGPNGSGKSNVIDSLLFVFGYRAQKIRSQSVGVLIHNSAAHPNVTSCSVDVYFQKIIDKSESDYDIVSSSEFYISRTAHKDNSSFYCINGDKVPFKEVSKLLRSHGIDLDHNRFLILQGEVEQISLMKPKSPNEHETGMLEFLEDIIGSGRLKEPIEMFAKKVEELNEQRSEKLNRVKVVEKEKEELEGPKEEALEYINAKNQVVVKQHSLTQFYMYELQQKMEESREKKKAFEVEMQEFLTGYQEIENSIKEKLKDQENVVRKYKEICKGEEEKQASFSSLELEDIQKGEELKHAVARKKELTKILEKEKLHLNELKDAPVKLEKEIKEMEIKSNELEQKRIQAEENLKEVMASLHTSTKGLQEEKDKHESDLMELQKIVDDTNSKMSIAKVEFDLYMKNGEDAKKRLNDLEIRRKEILEKGEQLEKDCSTLHLNIPKVEQKLVEEQAELARVVKEESALLNQLRNQRAKLEEGRAALQSSQNRGRVLKDLMQEKYSGRIPGIIGRLGDLGAIDDKYDIAISTACSRLDDIVTDTLRTAELCVEFLKRNNLGRATFISLDKMQEWANYIRKQFKTPEGSHRLFDLVKVQDKQLLPAFYFALRNTLVANDIHQATAIGLQGNTRHRVVTLNGEMIEASGAMSGGGDRPIKGKMGSAVVKDMYSLQQIEEMEKSVHDLQQQTESIGRQKINLQESIDECRSRVSQMKYDVEKHTMEKQGLVKQLEQLTALLKKQNDKVVETSPDEKLVKELKKKIEVTEEKFKNATEAASKVKELVLRLHNEIVEIGGNKMNAAQKQVQDINKESDKITSKINKCKVDMKSVGRNLEKTQKKIVSVEAELNDNALTREALKKALKDDEDRARDILAAINLIKIEKEKLENELKSIKDIIKDLTSQKQALDSKKIDIDHQLSQLTAAEDTNKQRLTMWEKELSKMVIEQVEGTLPCQLTRLTEDELKTLDVENYKFQVTVLEEKLKKLKPNLSVIAEYRRKEELYLQRVEELDAITGQRDAQRNHHDNLRKQRLTEFMTGFQIITYKVKETYQMLTLGGDAELELVNSLDPFSDGIIFSVRPPRKSWKNIVNLSGGEKTLSSLSLVFALHYYKPTPFYVMDEIDAALDFRNVAIVGHYIKEQTKNAQFIVISLRNNMFELAKRLIGIYKTFNTSHSVSINS